MKEKTEFDAIEIDGCCLEVIGGNHRREAYSQLIKEEQLGKSSPVLLNVLVYTGKFIFYLIKKFSKVIR